MKSRRSWLWTGAGMALITGLTVFTVAASNTTQERNVPGLMLAKLASTQRVVTGLVSKDFNEITKGAKEMISVCDATEWETRSDTLYGHYKTELRRQATNLAELARTQNLEGAAFSYLQTISTCISCHSHCRDVLRIAAVPNRVIQIPVVEGEYERSGMPIFRR